MTRVENVRSYPKYAPGGGYIFFDPENKMIHIFGTSIGFGPADHKLTAHLLKRSYPEHTITIASPDVTYPADDTDGKYAPIYYPWELDEDGNPKKKFGIYDDETRSNT